MKTDVTEVVEVVEIVETDGEIAQIRDSVVEVVEVEPNQGGHPHGHHHTLEVKVRYITSRKPFIAQHVSREETLSVLKPRVLEFFGLVEGSSGGGTKTYSFALNGILQTNLMVTLGSLAEGRHELKLDLIERFEQG